MNYETYFQNHREQHLEELKELLRIPSISALSEHKSDITQAANWIADKLRQAGMDKVEVHPTTGNPVIYAEHLQAPGCPTVLVYGHYDVQPVDPLHLWETPPFEPTIRDGKLYARGATDDKGQLFLHIKAVEAILKEEQKLPVNIKFCIEGEEEISSPSLPAFLESHAEMLAADAILISDTSLLEPGKPAICTGLRGLCELEISVHTANTDLHSGTFGGGVPNALHALVSLLTSLHDEQGRVAVEGFYEGVHDLTPEMREEFAKQKFNEDKLKTSLRLDSLYGEEGFSFVERTGARPTLELNGVYGGFQGEGSKTVIPKEAHAKITCRLVGQQDPQATLDKVERHLHANIQSGAKITVVKGESARAFTIDPSDPMLQKAADAYERIYGTRALFTQDGGSIPIVETLSRVLSAPAVMMGFGLPDENLHAPNEHFNLENFDKGMLTIVEYLKSL
ncbi:acetylornithine deacetylase/succinyl-diaminopimelate desuccinylase-like protein [Paenibacillus anaericanus]|uniref:dipeptidase n=1 Tax=Paenibacillus anaericanus TaxID=170367 RepID=UPI00278747A9|nr:dipeptidase [Paenibacillus anaericanus]MDQ0090813.1 acetylornithine deacetylase/succinyl-diaminopimelate desuccinylase-like protein [Paenibacillus anaericanus]